MHILVVEDDAEIRGMLNRFLVRQGYSVSTAINKIEIETCIMTASIDLILLDLMLPQESGQELCQFVRETKNIPVIMVTALAETRDRIAGLDLGADDYVSKPFDLRELEARMRAVMRRAANPLEQVSLPPSPHDLVFGPWTFVPSKRALYARSGLRVTLSGSETDLMLVFWQHPDVLLTRARLIELIYGSVEAVEERTIDLLVSRLRRKLAEGGRQLEMIRTVRGDGYIFDLKAISR